MTADPEYADVAEDGQLALGVPGEQRTLDGLAPSFVFVLSDGSWRVQRGTTQDEARKRLTRSQRKRVAYVRESRPTREWDRLT